MSAPATQTTPTYRAFFRAWNGSLISKELSVNAKTANIVDTLEEELGQPVDIVIRGAIVNRNTNLFEQTPRANTVYMVVQRQGEE